MMPTLLRDTTVAKNILAFCMGFPGLLCLLAPRRLLEFSMEDTTGRKGFNDLTVLIFQCFGSQAMLVGTVLYSAERLGASGFKAFAAAMVPYLAFNVNVMTKGANVAGTRLKYIPNMCDMINNAAMLAVAMVGLKLSANDDAGKDK